ncbi:SDR family NAD(P)-dependent oxidoreductase [Erythrobacter sp. EC-HK427]|uniref:SDR family NAD(P)-dependent oxidoreductase n=1 Tax=Erythrobacter sp. EC-HK427 TaxID=2038396 RepID=UPI0012537FEB|nr:SDR family NAD(P)-dependent oxidoreductase [Erythrobacter sp. EC-HK427]VVT16194.1 conserved hypothetical protein [Erythrobacter sp. EC-HK427]
MRWKRAAIFGASGGIGEALATALAGGGTQVLAGSRSGAIPEGAGITSFAFDLTDEASIAAAAAQMRATPPDLVIVASGVLTLPDGTGPERSYRHLEAAAMAEILALNTIGPALIAKHILPLFQRDAPATFAALSARVGSIGDNRIGGWHSYRASKAALNMLLRNFAIEMARTHKQARIVGLHPGTVDTALSGPFQKNLPDGQLTSPAQSAQHLLDVLANLTPADSGGVFDWKGARIEP